MKLLQCLRLLTCTVTLFISCVSTGQEADRPVFSHVSPLVGITAVAYPSPDPKRKIDTLRCSFLYSGTASSSITVTAIGDNHRLMIPVSSLAGNDTANTVATWVPGNDTIHFNFTGIRSYYLVVKDTQSEDSLITDTFNVIGYRPISLTAALPSTVQHADTLNITYCANADLISNVQVFVTRAEEIAWVEITGTTSRIGDTPPIRTYTTRFMPLAFPTVFSDSPPEAILFMLRDYTSPLEQAIVYTDTIAVTS